MPKFAAVFRFADPDRVAEVRSRHRAYLQELLAKGKLHASGPWADGTGALIVYEAADAAEARTLLAADPYAQADGLLADVQLKEWNRVYAAGE